MAATITAANQVLATVGPFPTTFTLSASCTDENVVDFMDGPGGLVAIWNVEHTCDYFRTSLVVKDGCLPSKYKAAFGAIAVAYVFPVFSPATAMCKRAFRFLDTVFMLGLIYDPTCCSSQCRYV